MKLNLNAENYEIFLGAQKNGGSIIKVKKFAKSYVSPLILCMVCHFFVCNVGRLDLHKCYMYSNLMIIYILKKMLNSS